MVALFPSRIDIKRGVFLNILGRGAGWWDSAFDSYLLLKEDGRQNHTLTLLLKIYLNPVTTHGLPLFVHYDSDNIPFVIAPWEAHAWQAFKSTFKQQALMWANKFWLTPPPNFSALDVKVHGKTFRPNIYCHLYIDLVASASAAHQVIDVVNLAPNWNSRTFRSHSTLYSSGDLKDEPMSYVDMMGTTTLNMNFKTVVHEIGHSLGLGHSGQLNGDPLCHAAIITDQLMTDKSAIPALFSGGSNSQACYGTLAPARSGDNVMGYGTSFDATNATPWLDRIAVHTHTAPGSWGVQLGQVAPGLAA